MIFAIVQSNRIKKFSEKYNIKDIPKGFKIKYTRKKHESNYYELEYPEWAVSNKNGTRDKRISYNYIQWGNSTLIYENSILVNKNPYN